MVAVFGTYAGMYDEWTSSEEGLTYHGIRRHAAYQAAGTSHGHWVVEPEVARAAATHARPEHGIEGYDTRWTVDGTQILYARTGEDVFTPLEPDDAGRYLLPQAEFPDVANEVSRGIVDQIITPDGLNLPGIDVEDVSAETWVPAPIRGAEREQRTPPRAETPDAPARDQAAAGPF